MISDTEFDQLLTLKFRPQFQTIGTNTIICWQIPKDFTICGNTSIEYIYVNFDTNELDCGIMNEEILPIKISDHQAQILSSYYKLSKI